MVALTVLRVFVGRDGVGGNPLGVVLEGSAVAEERRQAFAADLGYSETVFVDDLAAGQVRIFTPAFELPFAGHSLVGTAWLLAREGHAGDVIRPPAGEVATWVAEGLRWIRGRAEWAPAMDFVRLGSPAEVDALNGPPAGQGVAYCWAWADEAVGLIRARAFAPAAGIPEDEATGAAAVRLVTELKRAVVIHQGHGSELFAGPGPDGTAEVGGRVVEDHRRAYSAEHA